MESTWLGSLVENGAGAAGLLYRRNRYYDPQSGRFTQQDPIGIAGGVNLYGFAGGDPVRYSDPFGLCDTGKAWCQFWNNFVQGMRVVSSPEGGTCDGPGCKTGAFVGLFTMVAPTARAPLGGAAVAAEEAGASAQTIVGRRGFEVYVRPGTNAPARIGGRQFTGHSLDQMQGRGITPSMVEEALANGTRSAGRDGARRSTGPTT